MKAVYNPATRAYNPMRRFGRPNSSPCTSHELVHRLSRQSLDKRPLLPGNGASLPSLLAFVVLLTACAPDDSPLKGELDASRKRLAKQESIITSLQEGAKVMQQQIDLLNQELRTAKKETERVTADNQTLTANNRKLTADLQRHAIKQAQAAPVLFLAVKGGQSAEFPHGLALAGKAAEQVLLKNGYVIRAGFKTEEKIAYVTERKTSEPTTLEVPGFRNQYLVWMHRLPSAGVSLTVKAEFEKLVHGGRVIAAGAEEITEIERRLIAEIERALTASGKT